MRTYRFIILAAILFVSCSALMSQREQAREIRVREAKAKDIPFVYDKKDFGKIEIKSVSKAIVEEGVQGFPVEAPAHSCFYLEDKRPLPAFEKGARYFYPTYSFICVLPLTDASVKDFGKSYPYLNEAAVKLRALLKKRPNEFNYYNDINDLPFNNAGQSIQSRVQYNDFKTGTGVLFLTQYTQESFPNPINNEELTYNFQGITNDGKFYIAARLAVTHPSLPKGIDFTDHIERDEKHCYLKEGEKKLNALAEGSFQPSLRNLKALISSLKVE